MFSTGGNVVGALKVGRQTGDISIGINHGDKGRFGLYTKICDFTLLFMILQVELRLNKDH